MDRVVNLLRTTLLGLALGSFCHPVHAQEQLADRGLDVLSWNIYMRPAALFWNGQLKRARHIGDLLKDSRHDVLLLQEAFGRRSRKILRKALQEQYPHEVLPVREGRLFNSGLWVLSRLPVEDVVWVLFDTCAGVDCRAAKGAVLFTVHKEGNAFHVVNTHLQSGKSEHHQRVREEQYGTIATLLEENADPRTIQVVAGDLNTDQADVEAHASMVRRLKAQNGTLREPRRLKDEGMDHCTWGCSTNTLIPKGRRGRTKLIDHALVRRREGTGGHQRIRAERRLHIFTSPWSRRHRHLSDHNAISIRLVEMPWNEP